MVNQNSSNKKLIDHLNEIIDSNIQNERFGVSELAYELNMSRSNLHRKIKNASGDSVSQYLRKVRLKKALELLRNESITVAEAAYATGFGSATYFSKCFHDYFGYPPVEVSKQAFNEADQEGIKDDATSPKSRKQIHNFPVWNTSFIGREKEIGIISDLIDKYRIVTLTGTGGCGKTRLACEVVSQLTKDYPDGIWFIDFAPIKTSDIVANQLMNYLGIPELPGEDLMKTVIQSIRDKRMLILLDNCEHLLITCAEIARKLIESAPALSMLVTSREALNISGEKVWIIPSLSLVDPAIVTGIEQAELSEAIRLFIDRAKLNNFGFELVEKNVSDVSTICCHVDGIPLAIELVASRTRYMDTMTLLERLSKSFDQIPCLDRGITERHKTIHAAIDWSYNLLTEEEKVLFRRLSVFSGGFDLIEVDEVCANEILPQERILDLLSQLVEKSMIHTVYQPGQKMRYKLLDTLQRYASDILEGKNEFREFKNRHLEYFTRMTEKAYREQFEDQSKWAGWLDSERANLLSAMNWAESASTENFVKLSGYLSWYWRLKSDLILGMSYLERALARNIDFPEIHARALFGLGLTTWTSGDSKRAVTYMQKSLEIWRKLVIPWETAVVFAEISEPLLHSGDQDGSLKCSEEALEIARGLGAPGLINHCLIYFCVTLVHTKQYERGEPLCEELLISSEKLDNIYGIETALHMKGDCAVGMKNFNEGEKRYAKAIEASLKYGTLIYTAFDIQGVAFALSGQGRYAKAIRLDAAARELFKKIGVQVDGMVGFWDEWIETYIESAKMKLGEELTVQCREEGIKMGFEKAAEYALDFSKD